MIPRLADYDFVVVNTSGGKDSQTILNFVVKEAKEQCFGWDRLVCAHADLGRMEWPGTKELAEAQARHHGIRFWSMARPQGDLLTQIELRGMFPSAEARYCTSDQKRGQIRKLFTELVDDLLSKTGILLSKNGVLLSKTATLLPKRRIRLLNVMGMRAEESPARSKLLPFSHDASASNGRRHVDTWLAIHDWKLADVWKDIKESGVPYHKAYDLGMPRLSCVFCIFSPPAALMLAGRHNPELLDEYVQVEKRIGHTFRKDFPIEKVQQAIAAGEDWGKATDWVM